MQQQNRTRSIVVCGLAIALMSVGAFITVPLPGMIPFTLQSMMLFIVLLLLGPVEALVAVSGYLFLGFVGLPIFSGMTGGPGKFIGPTGGYLVGYLVSAVVLCGFRVLMQRAHVMPRSMGVRIACDVLFLAITFVIYSALGTLWYSFSMGIDIAAAFVACVLPFVVIDSLKMAAAIVCVQPVRLALGLGAPATHTKTERP
jgi:biotin transport system substrate-specific component